MQAWRLARFLSAASGAAMIVVAYAPWITLRWDGGGQTVESGIDANAGWMFMVLGFVELIVVLGASVNVAALVGSPARPRTLQFRNPPIRPRAFTVATAAVALAGLGSLAIWNDELHQLQDALSAEGVVGSWEIGFAGAVAACMALIGAVLGLLATER